MNFTLFIEIMVAMYLAAVVYRCLNDLLILPTYIYEYKQSRGVSGGRTYIVGLNFIILMVLVNLTLGWLELLASPSKFFTKPDIEQKRIEIRERLK